MDDAGSFTRSTDASDDTNMAMEKFQCREDYSMETCKICHRQSERS